MGSKNQLDSIKFGLVAHMVTGSKVYRWHIANQDPELFKDHTIKTIQYWSMIPKIARNKDLFKSYVWNLDSKDLIFYGIKAEVYKPKETKKIFLW